MQEDNAIPMDSFMASLAEVPHWVELLVKHLRQELSAEEQQRLDTWLATHPSYQQVFDNLNNDKQLLTDLQQMKQVDLDGWWKKISAQVIPPVKTIPWYRRRMYAAASLLLLLIGVMAGAFYFYTLHKHTTENGSLVAGRSADVLTHYKATLLMADGSVIDLSKAPKQWLWAQGEVLIKNHNGWLAYEPVVTSQSNGISYTARYNTLLTFNGGQYRLTLPDNSSVWLNAASAIRFPTSFSGNEREVELSGEAYFEIAPRYGTYHGKRNQLIPFVVKVLPSFSPQPQRPVGRVEVFGTRFTITAYADDNALTTTLLQGRVKVESGQWSPDSNRVVKEQQAAILQPGEQARIAYTFPQSQYVTVQTVDTLQAIAWMNGFIAFKDADIKTIMRMIARWYDVQLAFAENIPAYKFTGSIPRNSSLLTVLKILKTVGIHCTLNHQNTLEVHP